MRRSEAIEHTIKSIERTTDPAFLADILEAIVSRIVHLSDGNDPRVPEVARDEIEAALMGTLESAPGHLRWADEAWIDDGEDTSVTERLSGSQLGLTGPSAP